MRDPKNFVLLGALGLLIAWSVLSPVPSMPDAELGPDSSQLAANATVGQP